MVFWSFGESFWEIGMGFLELWVEIGEICFFFNSGWRLGRSVCFFELWIEFGEIGMFFWQRVQSLGRLACFFFGALLKFGEEIQEASM